MVSSGRIWLNASGGIDGIDIFDDGLGGGIVGIDDDGLGLGVGEKLFDSPNLQWSEEIKRRLQCRLQRLQS